MGFFKYFIRQLLDEGNVVDVAANMLLSPVPEYYQEWGCNCFQISCTRNPLCKGNLIAIYEIEKIVSQEHYDIVHCHTPIAAACTRMACREARKNRTKVIYTAHGFHFYKGAHLKNWLLFYPVEKLCSFWTDVLITINTEDYELAKRVFHVNNIAYIRGVGIDILKFKDTIIVRREKRQAINVPVDCFLLFSVGELNINKNHQIVLKALALLQDKRIHYMIAGKGNQQTDLLVLASELDISNQIHLLGFRKDVAELYKAADVYVLPSIREGLNVSVMEAMASGLPCLISRIRGNVDLIDEGKGGFLFNPFSVNEVAEAIKRITQPDIERFGKYNTQKVGSFSVESINKLMENIYQEVSS